MIMATRKASAKTIDRVIGLKKDGEKVSIAELEKAYASQDLELIDNLVRALREPHNGYTAKLYPFGGVRLTTAIQVKRCEKWFKDGILLQHLYQQAKMVKRENEPNVHEMAAEISRLKAEKSRQIETNSSREKAMISHLEADNRALHKENRELGAKLRQVKKDLINLLLDL